MSAGEGAAAAAPREAPCPLCGASERAERFRDGPHAVVDCDGCGLTYVTPRLPPEALLAQVYDGGYWRSDAPRRRGYADYLGEGALYRRTFALRKRFVDRWVRGPGRALDVGCAAGYFLEVLRAAGWDVTGVEPSAPAREAARAALGAERVLERLDHAALVPGSFDLITMWDVVEHLPDPVASLRRARELLAPGGRLVLETQNVASLAARALGRRWQHYKHSEHLFHLHPGTLTALLGRAGLRPLARTARYGGKYVSPAFVAERAANVSALLARLLSPLARLGGAGLYVNLFDEMLVVAEPWTPTPTSSS